MLRSTGAVTDRPWGVTLAELGVGGFTGLLTVTTAGKEYSISFDLGRVVSATSPLASDAAVRVALTNHLVTSSQIADLNRRVAAAKDRDELEVLSEIAGLTSEHVDKLRLRLVAQRAARTFSLEEGTYTADEKIAMPPGAELDVREVIYLGARMNLTEQRLSAALRTFGSVFTIKPDALPSIEQYGFGAEERPVIQGLLGGVSVPELEAAHRDLDPRMVQAIVYALTVCGACAGERSANASGPVVAYTDGPVVAARTITPTGGATYFASRTQTGSGGTRAPTNPGDGIDPVELPSATTIPPPLRKPASPTDGSTMRAPARPVVDDGVPRIPPGRIGSPTGSPANARTQTSDPALPRTSTGSPATARTQTSAPALPRTSTASPASARTQTSDPASSRTSTGSPASARTQTSDPAMPRTPTPQPATSRTQTGDPITDSPPTSDPTGFRTEPVLPRTATPRPSAGSSTVRAPGQPTIPKGGSRPDSASSPPTTARTQTSDPGAAPTAYAPAVSRTATGPVASRTPTSDPAVARTASGRPAGPAVARTSTARKTQALIAARMILVEQAADYFTLLGVPYDAALDVIQTAYLNVVRQLHPDKLVELGVPDPSGNAHRLFQQIGLAFTVLTDPTRRTAYLEKIGRPPATVEMTSRTRTADDIPATPAGDAYRRGEGALRRDQPAEAVIEFGRACALEPNNVDFHGMLGWAQFCAARDKVTIAPETRKALDRAIQRSAKPTQPRFLLGRVERMLGRDREALRLFLEVVEASPQHAEAAAEIRAIEARLAKSGKR